MVIDLRSDTVTKPTRGMLEAMFSAKVGDDVFNEDPTVIALEEKMAKMFGAEAGLFCSSGTMANQIAIKIHTKPGDEIICDSLSHIYNYEGGGAALNSGVSVKLMNGNLGRFSACDVENAINPDDVHYPVTKMVAIENTCNKGGGSIWDWKEIEKISLLCKEKNFRFHLDGARIFNALEKLPKGKNKVASSFGKIFSSVSVCLSKGLGAPVGSVLLGDKNFIYQARRVRKVFGGGMRQAGYLAAAGIYALDNNIERLKEDHYRAKQLEKKIKNLPFVKSVFPVGTNIVIFELTETYKAEDFISNLFKKNIKVIMMGPQKVRMVTHLDFTDEMLESVLEVLGEMQERIKI